MVTYEVNSSEINLLALVYVSSWPWGGSYIPWYEFNLTVIVFFADNVIFLGGSRTKKKKVKTKKKP